MKNLQTVLKNWAVVILDQTKDFDIEECVTIQYGHTPLWERFFKEMRESRGWDKVRKGLGLKTIKEARSKMIDMLNREIEVQYETQMLAAHKLDTLPTMRGEVLSCS